LLTTTLSKRSAKVETLFLITKSFFELFFRFLSIQSPFLQPPKPFLRATPFSEAECKGKTTFSTHQMFFDFIFQEFLLSKTSKPATSLSLSYLLKNYPSLERSAKISALFPLSQIFFIIQSIYLLIIPQ